MPKSFDATMNSLIDAHLDDWARYLANRCGVPMGRVSSIDTDLSVNLQADRLFRIDGQTPLILHLELESSSQRNVPRRMLRYNSFTHELTELPVHSILLLLRPEARASDQTGVLSVQGGHGREYLRFEYSVIRLWEERLSDVLNAGLGLTPLSILTNEASANLPAAFEALESRVRQQSPTLEIVKDLLSSVYILCGLRYEPEQIELLYRNLSMTLEDSTTYQQILKRGEQRGIALGEQRGIALGEQRGKLESALAITIRLGIKRFGPIPSVIETSLRAITELATLEAIGDRLLDVTSWDELLQNNTSTTG